MPDAEAVAVAGTFRVPPENLAALTPHIEAYVRACRKEDGCEAFSFAQDLLDPGLVRVFEIWRDDAALDAHTRTNHVRAWRAVWPQYGVHERSLTRYAVAGRAAF